MTSGLNKTWIQSKSTRILSQRGLSCLLLTFKSRRSNLRQRIKANTTFLATIWSLSQKIQVRLTSADSLLPQRLRQQIFIWVMEISHTLNQLLIPTTLMWILAPTWLKSKKIFAVKNCWLTKLRSPISNLEMAPRLPSLKPTALCNEPCTVIWVIQPKLDRKSTLRISWERAIFRLGVILQTWSTQLLVLNTDQQLKSKW